MSITMAPISNFFKLILFLTWLIYSALIQPAHISIVLMKIAWMKKRVNQTIQRACICQWQLLEANTQVFTNEHYAIK